MTDQPHYTPLRRVLDLAHDQAASGKGQERHGNGKPFVSQPIMEIARMVGIGYQLGQAMKKAQEASRLPTDRAKAELLGAINYLAAAWLLLDEGAQEATPAPQQALSRRSDGNLWEWNGREYVPYSGPDPKAVNSLPNEGLAFGEHMRRRNADREAK